VSVEVRVPTMLRPQVGGSASVQAEGDTVGQALDDLVGRFPGLGGQVVTDEGALHKFVNVYVNDDDIRYLGKLDTKVGSGDVISILPAVAGGAV
jgi:molybdopterin synthase sulfur carrier subunit